MSSKLILNCAVTIFLLWGCTSEPSNEEDPARKEAVSGKLEITDGWARPGIKGKTSAAYLSIINGTESADTLIGIFTEAARVAELHNSYENDDGIMSMKPAKNPVIEAGEVLHFQPGGYHIMLMELKRDLASGDSLQLSLKFDNAGIKTVTVPVKL